MLRIVICELIFIAIHDKKQGNKFMLKRMGVLLLEKKLFKEIAAMKYQKR